MRLLLLVLLAAGCSSKARTNPDVVAKLVEEGEVPIDRSPKLAVETIETELPSGTEPYRLGPNDVLHVAVVGHPEFLNIAREATGEVVGRRVQTDGRIYLPRAGGLVAAGRTVPELSREIAERLEKYFNEPQVTVEILRYGSQKFYVLGEVEKPGVFAVDGTATLLDGLARAGGVKDTGDLEGAYVIRAAKLLPVSLGDILLRGDTSRNVAMRDGDLVYVPDKADWKVYVLGEVKKPGIVPMTDRGLNLADAIAAAEDIDPLYADKNVIRIFRGSWQHPRMYTVSIEDLYRWGTSIRLRPGDRILVAPRGLANWSRAVQLLLPFAQTAVTAAATSAALTD